MTVCDLGEVTAKNIITKRPFNSMEEAKKKADIRKGAMKRLKVDT